jgi:glutathione S-transferase
MVLHEKRIAFEVHEVDLSNKSEEFLSVSPYGKVPVLRVKGTSLYESNIVNECLDEVYESPGLMPDDPEGKALVRSWMSFADDYFFPSVYRVRMGLQRGYSEDEIEEAKEKLYDTLSCLEHQLEGREYLVGATRWRTSPMLVTSSVYESWPRAARFPCTNTPTSWPGWSGWRVERATRLPHRPQSYSLASLEGSPGRFRCGNGTALS